jgi:aminoglycoside phosphotransferase
MKQPFDLRAIASCFQIDGELVGASALGSGHINDTFSLVFDLGGPRVRYVLQRINHGIFTAPAALMENVQRVTAHLAAKLAEEPDRTRRTLTLVPARDGRPYVLDHDGNYWRTYLFIERARTYDAIETAEQATAAAKAFGRFQTLLLDLPSPRLHETIPDFHHTPKRFAAFERALQADVENRAGLAKVEIDFALRHKPMAGTLMEAELPERITHNDTKLNNVMLDDASNEGICVIDLDTVMPGFAPYDFGDMVRTATSPAKEDEQDLSKVTLQFSMFEALARGYLSSAGAFLTKEERRCLVLGGKLMTFEVGLRFLTDFLAGDTYYKVHRPGHNLDRCRTQFKLTGIITEQEDRMNKLVERL